MQPELKAKPEPEAFGTHTEVIAPWATWYELIQKINGDMTYEQSIAFALRLIVDAKMKKANVKGNLIAKLEAEVNLILGDIETGEASKTDSSGFPI